MKMHVKLTKETTMLARRGWDGILRLFAGQPLAEGAVRRDKTQPQPAGPAAQYSQYYVAGTVTRAGRDGTAVYALLPLSKEDAAAIAGLDQRLAGGDKSVRQLRKRFFSERRRKCLLVAGKASGHNTGDLVAREEVLARLSESQWKTA